MHSRVSVPITMSRLSPTASIQHWYGMDTDAARCAECNEEKGVGAVHCLPRRIDRTLVSVTTAGACHNSNRCTAAKQRGREHQPHVATGYGSHT